MPPTQFETKTFSQIEIIEGLRKNDSLIFKYLYADLYPKVRAYILKNNGNEEHAKDIFQESFISCWKNINEDSFTVNERTNIEAYLFTISKNKWKDYLGSVAFKRTTKLADTHTLRKVPSDFNDEIDENEAIFEEKLIELKRAFNQLGSACKELLTQFYYKQKSMDALASKYKMSSASVRNKKYRCMQKLKSFATDNTSNDEQR